jgi:hypothetical protein
MAVATDAGERGGGFSKKQMLKYGGCHVMYYHSKECQINSWPSHKSGCKALATKPAAKK